MAESVGQRELVLECPWGLLLVTDERSTEEIPSWTSDAELVAAAPSAMVVRVRHQQEGSVSVFLGADDPGAELTQVFTGELELESGVLVVSDALGDSKLRAEYEPGRWRVSVSVAPEREASVVVLTIGESSGSL